MSSVPRHPLYIGWMDSLTVWKLYQAHKNTDRRAGPMQIEFLRGGYSFQALKSVYRKK
jgi:hypothetical protein